MLFTDVFNVLSEIKPQNCVIYSFQIPEKQIEKFKADQSALIGRINDSRKIPTDYASNKSKGALERSSFDLWAHSVKPLKEFEEKMTQKFEERDIFVRSSSLSWEKEAEAYKLKVKLSN